MYNQIALKHSKPYCWNCLGIHVFTKICCKTIIYHVQIHISSSDHIDTLTDLTDFFFFFFFSPGFIKPVLLEKN